MDRKRNAGSAAGIRASELAFFYRDTAELERQKRSVG
jgi:hypothetical protein